MTLLVVLAGCSGPIIETESSPATLPDDAIEDTPYVHQDTRAVPLTYRAVGVIPIVSAQTWATISTNPTGATEPPILLLYTSPNREVAGQSMNPTKQLSNRELVGFVLDRVINLSELTGLSAVKELRVRDVTNLTVLGKSTELVSYAGTADVEGESVGIVLNLAVVEHDGDVVLALGAYEDTRDEQQMQVALVQRINHGTEDADSQ